MKEKKKTKKKYERKKSKKRKKEKKKRENFLLYDPFPRIYLVKVVNSFGCQCVRVGCGSCPVFQIQINIKRKIRFQSIKISVKL